MLALLNHSVQTTLLKAQSLDNTYILQVFPTIVLMDTYRKQAGAASGWGDLWYGSTPLCRLNIGRNTRKNVLFGFSKDI